MWHVHMYLMGMGPTCCNALGRVLSVSDSAKMMREVLLFFVGDDKLGTAVTRGIGVNTDPLWRVLRDLTWDDLDDFPALATAHGYLRLDLLQKCAGPARGATCELLDAMGRVSAACMQGVPRVCKGCSCCA